MTQRVIHTGDGLAWLRSTAPRPEDHSIITSLPDSSELSSLTRRLDCSRTVDHEAVPPSVAEFIVSVTLREPMAPWARTAPLQ